MFRRIAQVSADVPAVRQRILLSDWRGVLVACALLVVIAGLAYLPLVGQLGYYHDDWFTVASRVSGVSLSDMHYVDRPMMGKIYEQTHNLLGDRPLNWHLFAFAVR